MHTRERARLKKKKKGKKYDAFDGMEEESLFNLIEWKIVRNPTMLYNLFEYTRGVHQVWNITRFHSAKPTYLPSSDFKDDLHPHFLHIFVRVTHFFLYINFKYNTYSFRTDEAFNSVYEPRFPNSFQ